MLPARSGFCLPVPETRCPSRAFRQSRIKCFVDCFWFCFVCFLHEKPFREMQPCQGEGLSDSWGPRKDTLLAGPCACGSLLQMDLLPYKHVALNCCFSMQHGLLITCVCGPPSSCCCSVPCIISACLRPSALLLAPSLLAHHLLSSS